jgi:aminopeptidase N
MYFKGALFNHTLRSVINDLARRSDGVAKADDVKFFKLLKALYTEFKYKNSFTEEMVAFVSKQLGQDMTPIFDQYLRRSDLPVLELTFNDADKTVWYRWNAAERAFAMPIRVGDAAKWQTIQPSAEWKSMPWTAGKDQFKVATDLYYVKVAILDERGHPVK